MTVRSLTAFLTTCALIAALFTAANVWRAGSAQALAASPIDPVVTNCNTTPPNAPIVPHLRTSGLPCAATIIAPFTLNNIQHGFDYYSWLTFMALNVPGDGSGQEPQWQNWKDLFEIMLPNGQTPLPWGRHAPPPKICSLHGDKPGDVTMQMVGKLPNLLTLSPTSQPFNDGPLIDQDGRYVRYQIVVNRPMFEYILQNHLYSKKGQAAFAHAIDFPSGQVTKDTTGTVGAIMIKAAWKVLDKGDNPSRFHTIVAYVYTPAVPSQHIAESCLKQRMALVGMHIVHKTVSDPQWVWSTFEQVDNDPQLAHVESHHFGAHYSFFNPKGCLKDSCLNQTPPRPWNPNVQPFPNGFRSQIARVLDVTPEVGNLNAAFQRILGDSPWTHYQLISTQWPTNSKSKIDPTGAPAPVFLANTTMETYVQGTVPQSSSSCIKCHVIAVDTASKKSDFTYVLERAH